MNKKKLLKLAAIAALPLASTQLHAAWTATVMDTWPNAVVPYEIDESLLAQPFVLERFYQALEEFETKTVIRFVERTPENADQYPNYKDVYFDPNTPYSSAGAIGMTQGMSRVQLGTSINSGLATDGSNYGLAVMIHELGHVVGLIHENSRADIWDAYSIDWGLVTKDNCVFPDRNATPQTVFLTDYDYHSVMNGYAPGCGTNHLGGPSRNYATPNNPDVPERDVVHQLSDWDVVGINTLYEAVVLPAPPLLTVTVTKDTWDGGYCAHVNVINTSDDTISAWETAIDLGDSEIYYDWSADVTEQGAMLIASSLSWNAQLASQQSTAFGFCANGVLPEQTFTAVAKEQKASADLAIGFSTQAWQGGYCAYIHVANTSNQGIEHWQLNVDIGASHVYERWSAAFEHDGSSLHVSGDFLGAQESTEAGFCANGELPSEGMVLINQQVGL